MTGIQFYIYFYLRDQFNCNNLKIIIDNYSSLINGSVAGLVAYLFTYPIDSIRKNHQVFL